MKIESLRSRRRIKMEIYGIFKELNLNKGENCWKKWALKKSKKRLTKERID
jgi:hypothetical protein